MMSENSGKKRVEQLRAYLLGTLSCEETRAVETLLDASEDARAELERQRAALRVLDSLAPVEPPVGLATRTMAYVEEAATREEAQRSWRSRRAFVYGVLAAACVLVIAVVLPALGRAREAAHRASSQNNLKQLALVFKMYANENRGEEYPPLTPYEGLWMFDLEKVYPKYISDVSVLVNPSRPDADELLETLHEAAAKSPIDYETMTRVAAKSYTYPGWVVWTDEDVRVLRDSRRKGVEAPDREQDIQTPSGTLRRPREGVERFLITDINNPAASASAQSEIPVLFENVAESGSRRRQPAGANVAFMDGHVEFVPAGEFPVTETTREALQGEPGE
ncbi:MAG: DUF1559 domain-containing protein [Candidatus Hydrogenedentes bacterium]|nr:DUF1559 domain-containing protein [Candidatus Hydrogenedentota bacterium]